MPPKKVPNLIYSDHKGNIYDVPELEVAGRSSQEIVRLEAADFIEMPDGTEIHQLPGRKSIGFNKETGKQEIYPYGKALAAFIAPAHTQYYLAAFKKKKNAPVLPLFAYSAIGWLDDRFYVSATRIDPDIRQDCRYFDQNLVMQNVNRFTKKFPKNRLLRHLAHHCALKYYCPAARNFFLERWEAPLPTSIACNCKCIGCISLQPVDSKIVSPQDRIRFIPTPEEIAEVSLEHMQIAPDPIVSFGQGCEGEPLVVWEVIKESIRLIRKKTKSGIINLNTNGSIPHAVEELFKTGLNSIRVSLNSARENLYNSYYRPSNYTFQDVCESIKIARIYKKWASINYFVFPGVTDEEEEYNALKKLIQDTKLNMIQWRNFNIDPDYYFETMIPHGNCKKMTMQKLLEQIKKDFPNIVFGYFNPPQGLIDKAISSIPKPSKKK